MKKVGRIFLVMVCIIGIAVAGINIMMKYQVNTDGTITLTVQALSTDLKTDCLFAHEVTVRPLENGRFQYVGNKVTLSDRVWSSLFSTTPFVG